MTSVSNLPPLAVVGTAVNGRFAKFEGNAKLSNDFTCWESWLRMLEENVLLLQGAPGF